MNANQILKIYGTDYLEMTVRLLEEADLAAQIPGREACIGIKPNLVVPSPADFGATTHPEIVEGIIEYLHANGFGNILIAEGSWVGDKTAEAFEYCGYRELCERYDVPFEDTQKDRYHSVDCAGVKLNICDVAGRIDFMINVPVLKGHCQTKITCALKNMKGLIPNTEKRRFHKMGLHRPIAHLSKGIRQDFIVVDHICGDLDFEEGGNPVTRNCIMAAMDPVLVDSYVCRLLQYDVDEVPYIRMAEKLGSGCADLQKAEIILLDKNGSRSASISCEGTSPYCGSDDVKDTDTAIRQRSAADVPDEALPRERRILQVSYAVDEVDSCSACYGSLVPALYRLKEEGLLDYLTEKIAIGQGHQGKRGMAGIGKCTSGFDFCIMGCPPDEDKIYRELKEYLEARRDKARETASGT